ncbi:hypothetical protein SALLE_v1c03750 [Spiroplasma alleghenense]|uniref:Uncharacterized protein n=2 Tax=Spiroplasma alleghenense TaxID=216931 RepID=A0A345Z370_9MOLU|nr:hypothetical protein SALLE_v1c03750 [Spiroplasma alleghenense]
MNLDKKIAIIRIRPDSETIYPPIQESKLNYYPEKQKISFTALRSLAEINLLTNKTNCDLIVSHKFEEIITNFQQIAKIDLNYFTKNEGTVDLEFIMNPKWDLTLKKSNRIVAHGDLIAEWSYESPTKKERSDSQKYDFD